MRGEPADSGAAGDAPRAVRESDVRELLVGSGLVLVMAALYVLWSTLIQGWLGLAAVSGHDIGCLFVVAFAVAYLATPVWLGAALLFVLVFRSRRNKWLWRLWMILVAFHLYQVGSM